MLQELITKLEKKLDELPKDLEERNTEAWLVEPFLNGLGYNVRNHELVHPQYLADPYDRNAGKVDYAILKEERLIIFVEAKRLGENLDRHYNQLKRYFNNNIEVNFAILTNGDEYRFYTDLLNENSLDKDPFLTFKISQFDWSLVSILEQFSRERYNAEKLRERAYKLYREKEIVSYLEKQKTNPDESFVAFVTRTVFKTRREAIQKLVKESLSVAFQKIESLQPPLPPNPIPPEPVPDPPREPINIFDITVLSYIRPEYIIFENQREDITNWRDVLEYLMKKLLDRDVGGISQLHSRRISTRRRYRDSRSIGHGYYIEAHRSARDILSILKKSLSHLNLRDALYLSIRYTNR